MIRDVGSCIVLESQDGTNQKRSCQHFRFAHLLHLPPHVCDAYPVSGLLPDSELAQVYSVIHGYVLLVALYG